MLTGQPERKLRTGRPAPGFPPNHLGELNPWTGQIAPVTLFGPAVEPQGMLFLP